MLVLPAVVEARQHAPTSTERAVSTAVQTPATTLPKVMCVAQTAIIAKEATPAPPKLDTAALLGLRPQDAQVLAVAFYRPTATLAIAIAIRRTRTHTHHWQLHQTTSISAPLQQEARLKLAVLLVT